MAPGSSWQFCCTAELYQKSKVQDTTAANQAPAAADIESKQSFQLKTAPTKTEDADIFENSLAHSMASDNRIRDGSRSEKRPSSHAIAPSAAPAPELHRQDAVFKPIAPPVPVMMQTQGQLPLRPEFHVPFPHISWRLYHICAAASLATPPEIVMPSQKTFEEALEEQVRPRPWKICHPCTRTNIFGMETYFKMVVQMNILCHSLPCSHAKASIALHKHVIHSVPVSLRETNHISEHMLQSTRHSTPYHARMSKNPSFATIL